MTRSSGGSPASPKGSAHRGPASKDTGAAGPGDTGAGSSALPAPSGWFQLGVALAALGFVVIVGNVYTLFLEIGPGDARGILWTYTGVIMGVPAILAVVAVVLLWRRRRWAFWLVTAEMLALFAGGLSASTLQTSGVVVQALLVVGIVLSVVGFFRSRTA